MSPITAGEFQGGGPGGGGGGSGGSGSGIAQYLYVTTNGNDSNNGYTWATAKLTPQAAIDALPSPGNTSTPQGGIVQLGYGAFSSASPVVISLVASPANAYGITLKGLGCGWVGNTLSDGYASPTTLVNTGTSDGLQVTGEIITSSAVEEYEGIVLEDFAVVGNSTSAVGVNMFGCPRITLTRINSQFNGTWGYQANQMWWWQMISCGGVANGTVGATTVTGGLNIGNNGTYQVNDTQINSCVFNENFGVGIQLSPNMEAFVMIGGDIEANQLSANAFSGAGVLSSNQFYTFIAVSFENNTSTSYRPVNAGGQHIFMGCKWYGNGLSVAAISSTGGADTFVLIGNEFDSFNLGGGIDVQAPSGGNFYCSGNRAKDTTFINFTNYTVPGGQTSGSAGGTFAVNGQGPIPPQASSSTQTLVAATEVKSYTSNVINITAASPIILTATPTVTTGNDAQPITIVNVGANAITFQSGGTLSGSKLSLGATVRAIAAGGALQLVYSGALTEWVETGYNAGGN